MPLSPIHLLTLRMDKSSFAWFNAQRLAYFPPERNHIAAHITLFHRLDMHEDTLHALLLKQAEMWKPFELTVNGVWLLGRGVAYRMTSPEADRLHLELRHSLGDAVAAQDKAFQPHITVQNKVSNTQARTLYEELCRSEHPSNVKAIGIDHWHYLGGPWQHIKEFAFGGDAV